MATPEFHIDDVIMTDDSWGGGVSSRSVREFLTANASATELLVRINSPGGDAFEGIAMYNALRRHGARIIVEVEGLAASAASVAAMAGDEIRVHKGAMIMIHEAAGLVWGGAEDLRKHAVVLQKINSETADIYAARTGQTRSLALQLMADETWMTAEEAVAKGFADAVVPAKSPGKPTPTARAQAVMKGFKRAPEALRAAAAPTSAPKLTIGELARHAGALPLSAAAAAVPTWRGCVFDDLQPTERATLRRTDEKLYDLMRASPSGPRTFAQLSGPQRAALISLDKAKYERMRDGSNETWTPKQLGQLGI